MQIGEITAPTPGNSNLFRWFAGVIKYQNRATPAAGNATTHQAGRPATNNHNIARFCHG